MNKKSAQKESAGRSFFIFHRKCFIFVPNTLTIKFSIAFLFSILTIQSFSQVDFEIRRQKLKPAFFDTTKENIFVYEVPNATLYFKQDDIQKFIEDPGNKNILANYGYKELLDTLTHKTQKIKITDYYFSYDQTQRDSIFKQKPDIKEAKKINEEFYFPCAALILKGQFMIFSKAGKRMITKGLIAKQEKGYMGSKFLEFYLPGKIRFYSILTRLGE